MCTPSLTPGVEKLPFRRLEVLALDGDRWLVASDAKDTGKATERGGLLSVVASEELWRYL